MDRHRSSSQVKTRAFSHSRPKSTSATPHPAQENPRFHRRPEDSRGFSDSSSCGSYSTEEDSYSYKLRSGGAPMKKLLAEELSKEAEVRRRPPSVIGRLMGLDTLPPQHPVVKPQKKFSENYLKKTAAIGGLNKRSPNEGRSRRTSSKEQQEFKDVYEVKQPDLRMREGMVDSYTDESRMEYVRQKFMDVKRLSTDEKLQQSKEYHEALEVLDSNKDILLKFLQERDSLFAKHIRDIHGFSSPPQPGNFTVLQSSNVRETLGRKSDKNTVRHDEQGAVGHSRRKNVYIPSKVPKSQTQEKGAQLPTRIVVLKPNLKKVQNTASLISSPDFSEGFHSGHRRNRGFGSSESLELFEEVRQRRDSSFELELMNQAGSESREIAREITRQMRNGVSSGSKVVRTSRPKGYAGDESSDSLSGNDSAYEPDVRTRASRHFNDLRSRCSPLSSYSNESSVSREAKKRLSERWKMTQKGPEVGKISRGNTLGEMLAMPDKETRSTVADPLEGINDRLSRNGVVTRCTSPLGISSRDGWKDEYVRSLPRSRSVPASSTCLGSPKRSLRYDTLPKDRCPMPKESVNWCSNSPRRLDSQHRGELFLKSNRKPSRKKSPYSLPTSQEDFYSGQDFDMMPATRRHGDGEKRHSVQDIDLTADELSLSFERLDSPASEPSTLDIPVDELMETAPSVNDREFLATNSNSEDTPRGPSEGNSFFSRCTIAEAESSASSKEAGEPSPISVLEPPFAEEISPTSDCFEKISADLHGLRMQLQLLKLESSDAYSEGSEMIVSSDEDIREGSLGHSCNSKGSSGMYKDEVNKDFSYIVDVLVDSGFHDADLDVLLRTWHSLELPVAPNAFDKLEKKYGELTSWLRSDRKLLFDRINMGLVELLRPHMDPHPWVKLGKPVGDQWNKEQVAEELREVLVRQDQEVSRDSVEKALKEMNWLDLRDDIDVVGSEIERLLFVELVDEVVRSLVVT